MSRNISHMDQVIIAGPFGDFSIFCSAQIQQKKKNKKAPHGPAIIALVHMRNFRDMFMRIWKWRSI